MYLTVWKLDNFQLITWNHSNCSFEAIAKPCVEDNWISYWIICNDVSN